ncbi:MAG: tetratricopeptide repeat protein [Armatimonadetes bacterium]|nr:tetratricopeptide repeat protein [Armatimonadota bacterium]
MAETLDCYDFFVSYARADNRDGWIAAFIDALLAEHRSFAPERELRPFFDLSDIRTGNDWRHTLTNGLHHAKLLLAFISPNYLASEWCRREWRAWLEAEVAKQILTSGARPIYIVRVPGLIGEGYLDDQAVAAAVADLTGLTGSARAVMLAETPAVVQHLRRRQMSPSAPAVDATAFYGLGGEALQHADLRQVLDELAHDVDRHAARVAQADSSLSTVPGYNPCFTGRLDELLELREQMLRDDRTGVIYGVHGLGGIGKTELAFAYAHAFAADYPGGRFLIGCERHQSLRDAVLSQHSFTSLFADRITDQQRTDPAAFYAMVGRCLRERLETLGPALLVLDNVSDLALLGREQTENLTVLGRQLHLLATTRLVPAGRVGDNWLRLDRLREDEAYELMGKFVPITSDEDATAARRVVHLLGGFALAVELAAAWLRANRGSSSYQRLADHLDVDELEDMAEETSAELVRHNHERRLSAVLGPLLAGLSAEQRRLMEYAALLPPDRCALPWLRELLVADFPALGDPGGLADPWAALWRSLCDLCLLTLVEDEGNQPRIVRVHRMVQALVRRGMDVPARQAAVDDLVKSRDAVLRAESRPSEARWEIVCLVALAGLWDSIGHGQRAWVINQAGLAAMNLAEYAASEYLLRRALDLRLAEHGAQHRSVAVALSNLAQVLQRTNHLAEAEQLLRRALAIDESQCGPDSEETAIGLNNLAVLLRNTMRADEAERLLRRALRIDEARVGARHPLVAERLSGLAVMVSDRGQLAEAEVLLRRAVDIDAAVYTDSHPNLAIHLGNLATCLYEQHRFEEALPLAQRALEHTVACFGRHHPDTATSLGNVAAVLHALGRTSEAEPLMQEALAIDEHRMGHRHPSVARDLNNLAMLYWAANRLGDAEPLMRRNLAIMLGTAQSTGHEHPHLRAAITNYRALLRAKGKTDEEATSTIQGLLAE